MAEKFKFEVKVREEAGKGAARAIRREGRIPAVIYGANKEPVTISLPVKETILAWHTGRLFTSVCELQDGKNTHLVLLRDLQSHPVTDIPMHADFLRVTDKTTIRVNVPVKFLNEEASEGLARGGILNVVRYDIEVFAQATKIPEFLTLDLSGTDIGDSLHFSQVVVPEGVTPTIDDRDFTVATIAAPSALRSAEGEAGEAADENDGIDREEEEGEGEASEEKK